MEDMLEDDGPGGVGVVVHFESVLDISSPNCICAESIDPHVGRFIGVEL